jgi:hypothetical protein
LALHFIKYCQSCDPVEKVSFMWETKSREIVAVLHPVALGEVDQPHSIYRKAETNDRYHGNHPLSGMQF